MLKSEIPRELDLAPPNAAGKQAEGKPLSAVNKRKVGRKMPGALGRDAGNSGRPMITPIGLPGGGMGTLCTYME